MTYKQIISEPYHQSTTNLKNRTNQTGNETEVYKRTGQSTRPDRQTDRHTDIDPIQPFSHFNAYNHPYGHFKAYSHPYGHSKIEQNKQEIKQKCIKG